MTFTLSDEQRALRSQARRFLEHRSPSSAVRRLMDSGDGFDRGVWAEMAGLGWLGVHIPESYGGAGLGQVELGLLLEEQGRALLCAPFFSTTCLAVNALLLAGSEAQKERYLGAIAAGDCVATLALSEPTGRWDATGITMTARSEGDGYLLEGVKTFVPDGLSADLILVAARTSAVSTAAGTEGISLFAVDAQAPGLTRTGMTTLDATRRLARLDFDGVAVGAHALLGDPGRAWPHIERVLDLAAVGLAAEQIGVGEKAFEMAVDYAKLRTAFGRPIGAFQAIKHKCADMLQDLETARSVAHYAAVIADRAADPHGIDAVDELAQLASVAKAYCCEVGYQTTDQNILIHGGIGFTWEHDAHLYFKRAKSAAILFGDAAYHHERLAQRLGL